MRELPLTQQGIQVRRKIKLASFLSSETSKCLESREAQKRHMLTSIEEEKVSAHGGRTAGIVAPKAKFIAYPPPPRRVEPNFIVAIKESNPVNSLHT